MFGGNVYEVEPTGRYGPDRHDNDRMKYFLGNAAEHFRSRSPLRVVRKVVSSE